MIVLLKIMLTLLYRNTNKFIHDYMEGKLVSIRTKEKAKEVQQFTNRLIKRL